jgi:DNA-binding NarL/FixJ family response regulator
MAPVKVVIFEDEFLLANDLKRLISPFNYEVTGIFRRAEDGLQYMADIEKDEDFPDIVLMDISLAGKMNGVEAAEIIAQKYNIALVFLTGMGQVELIEETFTGKPYALLNKPVDIKQALISIRMALYQIALENKITRVQDELEEKIGERTNELQLAKRNAEDLIRKKNSIIARMGQQIREPMLGILGVAAQLKQEAPDQPEIQQFTQYIDDNARHLFSVLNNITKSSDENIS